MDDDEAASHSTTATATTNNKRSSSLDASNTAIGGGLSVNSYLVPGSRLEARDGQGSDKWFSVKVQEVDKEEEEVLVHYHNWNSRHDEWIPIDSPRLRVPQRTSSRHDSGSASNSCDEGKDTGSSGAMGGESTTGMGIKCPVMKEFKSGERVMAVWKLNRKYPAKIVRLEPDGTYLVEFCEDGVECKVKPNNIRRMRKDEEEQYDIDSGTNGIDLSIHETSTKIEVETESARSSRRRERKMKFDLKSVLNIRTTPPPTPPPPLQASGDKTSKSNTAKADSKQSNSRKSVDTVNKSPDMAAKTNSSSKTSSANPDTKDKNKVAMKKDPEAKVPVKKKQPNQYTKRKEEEQKIRSKTKNVASSKASIEKSNFAAAILSLTKKKKKASKNLEPVTNGKDSTGKKSTNKFPTNNNSSKSSLGANAFKTKESNEAKSENYSSKSVEVVQTVTGKRERKRKKFWDEEDFPAILPPSKVPKKKTTEEVRKELKGVFAEPSIATSKNKNRRSSESASSEQPMLKSKNIELHLNATDLMNKSKVSITDDTKQKNIYKTVKKDEYSNNKSNSQELICNVNPHSSSEKFQRSENGKVLLYRTSFDMTEDPSKIASKMKEGLNIPGPGVSIPVDSSRLPKGWEKRVIQRGIGVTKGKWDVFIVEEEGRKSFRSKTDLQKHIDEKKLPYTSDAFDFSLDDNLKKLRQIWKQYIVKPRLKPGEKMSPLLPAKKGKKKTEGVTSISPLTYSSLSNIESTSHLSPPCNATSTLTGTTSPIGDGTEPKKATMTENVFSDLTSLERNGSEELIEQNLANQRQEREAKLIAEKLGVVSETGQGVRCSIRSCKKLFRKEKLLRQHVKHYHPKEYKEVIKNCKILLEHENDVINEMKPPNSFFHPSNNDILSMEGRKRKLSHQFDENNKRLKRNSVGLTSQFSADEDDLEIDSPAAISHTHVLTNNATRQRNDSMLSASSGFSDGDFLNEKTNAHSLDSLLWNGGNLSKHKSRSVAPSPSTPPTFRFSKRRQAQLRANRRNDVRTSPREKPDLGSSRLSRKSEETLQSNFMSPKVALTILDDSMIGSPASRLSDQQQLSPNTGCSQTPMNIFSVNASGQSSYPPSEMDVLSVTGSEHLTTEELVNCSCRRLEEDGLMIQCDICLCWQHGSCLSIEEEDQVPDYYVCETCRNPRLGRTSAKYSVDQDWLNKGMLPTAIPSTLRQKEQSKLRANTAVQFSFEGPKKPLADKETPFRKLSELMADLANLSKILHSLRVKLSVASQTNNSKVFMWSSLWDRQTSIVAPPKKQELLAENLNEQSYMGEMLTSVGESKHDISQEDIAANLNFLQSSSNPLIALSHPPNTHSLENNDLKEAAASFENKDDCSTNNADNSRNAARNIDGENNGSVSQPSKSTKTDVNHLINSSQNEHNNPPSSLYPCQDEKNTPFSEPPQSITVNKAIDKELSVSDSANEEAIRLNGENNEDSTSNCNKLNNSLVANSLEPSQKIINNEILNPNYNLKEGQQDNINQDETAYQNHPRTGNQTNGPISNHKHINDEANAEPNKTLTDKRFVSDTTSEMIVNGNINGLCKSDENDLLTKSEGISSPLGMLNNKENDSRMIKAAVNGEFHLPLEKNSIFTNCGEVSKNIAIATDKKMDKPSTNSQSKQEQSKSEPSEPQINGLLEENGVSGIGFKVKDNDKDLTEGSCSTMEEKLLIQDKENNKEFTANEHPLNLDNVAEDKRLGENSFGQTQEHDILDENQEVDPSMIPSLSEVQQLLPSLMSSLEEQLMNDQQQTSSGSLDESESCINPISSEANNIATIEEVGCQSLQQFHTQMIQPSPVIFPETKRIDKDECRLNLLHHIDAVQTEFEHRLNLVEKILAEIDSIKGGTDTATHLNNDTDEESDPAAKTKAILTLLLHDLKTSKHLVSLV